ncbi:MAG: twin-arginine translocase subunit TatC [Nitrospinaceae bacterium]|nr:twin-arginine translocase subunit TatC [Nitrospinaceae bacterium]
MVRSVKFTEKIPVSSHLIEVRDRMVMVGIVVALFFGVCFYFIDFLILWLQDPLPLRYQDKLIYIAPTEVFFTHMKVALMGSLFISMPVILYHIWFFIAPGLKVKEKKITSMFVAAGTLFFLFGGVFCYFLVLPLGLKFLLGYGSTWWEMQVTIQLYFNFVVKLILAFGFAFQTPLLMVLLTKFGVTNTIQMKIYRKWAFLGCFVLASVLTPPDIITQVLLGFPLYGLYEFGVIVSAAFEDPKERAKVLRQWEAEKAARKAAKKGRAKPASKKKVTVKKIVKEE